MHLVGRAAPVGDRSRWVEGVQLKWMQACYSSTGATPGIHGTPVGDPCVFQSGVCDEIPLGTNQDDDSDAVVVRKFYYRSEPCACSEEFINGQCVPLEEVYAKEWRANGDLWVHPYGQGSSCPPEQYPQQDSCPDGGKKGNGPNGEAGNPISCTSGIKIQTETDYRGAGPDPLTVQRHYRSDDGDPLSFAQPGYNMRLEYDSVREIAQLLWPDGGRYVFVINGDTGVSNDADKGTPTRTVSGWDYVSAGGVLYRFDDGNPAALLEIQRTGGRTQTVNYHTSGPGQGKIATVTNAFGVSLSYDYDAQGRVSEVQLPDGNTIGYAYDTQDRLTTVTYPDDTPLDNNDNPTRLYHYEDSGLPFALTGITDENGHRYATWAYDAVTGKAVLSEHAGGAEKVTLDYLSDTQTRVRIYQTATDYRDELYTFERLGGDDRVTEIETLPCTGCAVGSEQWQYNTAGFLTQD